MLIVDWLTSMLLLSIDVVVVKWLSSTWVVGVWMVASWGGICGLVLVLLLNVNHLYLRNMAQGWTLGVAFTIHV